METLRLWDRVEQTNTDYTKPASNGRFNFTTVDAQYLLKKATEQWGPYGHRWGLRDLKFTRIEHSLKSMMMLECQFFYPLDVDGAEREVSFPIAVDLAYQPSDEVCKKLITTARSKALSYLGFSADIFLGMFEDDAYVQKLSDWQKGDGAMLERAFNAIRAADTEDAYRKCENSYHTLKNKGTIPQHELEMVREQLEVAAARLGLE